MCERVVGVITVGRGLVVIGRADLRANDWHVAIHNGRIRKQPK